jgi:predicted TIM-barrel fold metal-dependent hydrolase
MELDFRPFDADSHYYEPLGVERILFGSDWPHGEGLAKPLTFTKELGGFAPDEVRKIMRDNVVDLLGEIVVSE